MTSGPRRVAGPVGEDRLPHSARLVLGHLGEAGAGDQLHGGEDPAHEVGAAGAHVLVGGVEDRLERGPERLVAGPAAPAMPMPLSSSALKIFSIRRLATWKPAVACRSPAMMTPSRYRTDNTVVPCGGSRGASVGAGDAPGIRCGASRRSRSTKLGFEESLKPRQRSPASIIAVTFRRSTARCCGAGRPRSVIR